MNTVIHVGLVAVATVAISAKSTVAQGDERSSSQEHSKQAIERIIEKEVVVSASTDEVWRAWTTAEGVTSFGPPKAKIELRVGGAYEWYFMPDQPPGSRGSDGCRILSYLPARMLSFDWNAPPSIPTLRDSGAKTQVVLELAEQAPGQVRVKLTQLGFGEGEDWDRYYVYFDKAWGRVLDGLQRSFESSGDKQAAMPEKAKRWIYFIRPTRPDFFDGATDEENRLISEHYHYLKDLFEKGTVIFAGRSVDPAYYPGVSEQIVKFEMPTPGLVVFEAPDVEAARRIVEGDPAVAAGVFMARFHAFNLAFIRE
jgi:uncharacterized protein YndB with AHSA1/START domain/uncharacterized protein YciI